MKKENEQALHWQSYLDIENELFDIADYVYITDKPYVKNSSDITPLRTYSNHISDLLVRCCTEIESIISFLCDSIYEHISNEEKNNYQEITSRRGFMNNKIFDLLNSFFSLYSKVVHIHNPIFDLSDKHKNIMPFKNFNNDKNGWKAAYQSIKHNRYKEFVKGNLGNLISACSALYLLNIYSRDVEVEIDHHIPFAECYSLGSRVFSLQKPEFSNFYSLASDNKPIISEATPLVVRFTDKNFEYIKKCYGELNEDLIKWINAQPEVHDPNYTRLVTQSNSLDYEVFNIIAYRINKYVDGDLTFEEQKEKFVHSQEWNYLKTHNLLDITETQLTSLTIDSEIVRLEYIYSDAIREELYFKPMTNSVDKVPLTICVYKNYSNLIC